ncbi:putative WD repeat-containing protein alr3466 [Camellia lanceoleosa]|uniref:WD repeat-containing protein alr3466 n=1 Tax=Camellia lanceoleosa TaxID=1840588 RepID=A0ACC0FA48_9ERIC|nr:putative WD repeat-containing protein alr3466 [Camellia lanceoleosa]
MSTPPVLKKPKAEEREELDGEVAIVSDKNGTANSSSFRDEQEEAMVALIEHRTKEVEHLRQRISYYKSQLDQAERRLEDSQSKLARLRGRDIATSSKNSKGDDVKDVKVDRRSASPFQISEDSSPNQPQSRPQLIVPAVNPKVSPPIKMAPGTKASSGSHSQARIQASSHTNSTVKHKGDKSQRTSEIEATEIQAKGTKRKFEQKEHAELIPLIRESSSPCTIRCQTGCLISSQHKRKLRSLVLCPTNDQLFLTSALDGVVNLWQVQAKGSSANLLSSTDCVSQKQRRWPEDIAWHPEGNSLFSVYSADGGDSQISVIDLNKTRGTTGVSFLDAKPHLKGIINNIVFMPWDNVCFVTGGSDHAVVLWTDKDGEDLWKPKSLHRNQHSSAVMGVAGMQQKQTILSVGADKRIIGFDLLAGRADYKHQIESKCMSVLPNPCDFNLFMVQTGTPERQLRLFDIRLRQTEIHAFGWKQESSESQSALINQAWSPDGLYITSGSADPVIHIFDIRYNARKPSQSVRAHQKRVFKAVWSHSLPLLISISSDLNVGLHKIM